MAKLFVVPKGDAIPKRTPTTVLLTFEQRLALMSLQTKRMVEGIRKPTVSEMVSEGLVLLFKKENLDRFQKHIFSEGA